jgi:hypothetical protein
VKFQEVVRSIAEVAIIAFGDRVNGWRQVVGERNPMNLEEEYRKYAADSLEIASKQPDNADLGHFF